MQTRRQLPNNIAELHAMLHAQYTAFDVLAAKHDVLAAKHDVTTAERDELKKSKLDDKEEIKRLTLLIAKLKRMVFGQKSEKLSAQIAQLELELEELHITQAARVPVVELAETVECSTPKRRPLPEHLPRDVQTHMPAQAACPDCGGKWKTLGEDVSEVLEYVPASYRVVRHVRPRLTCSCCERMAQAPAPSRPIARSYFGPSLISHVIVSKYMDHLPIYRQCQQAAREGVELSESTVGDVIGGAHQLLRPLMQALQRYVFTANKLHADDTPISVLAPGNGKTKQGRLWVYTRDDRPAGDVAAPAVWFRYSPDRKGIHPQAHLKDYAGVLQADAYAG
jgi:transposase